MQFYVGSFPLPAVSTSRRTLGVLLQIFNVWRPVPQQGPLFQLPFEKPFGDVRLFEDTHTSGQCGPTTVFPPGKGRARTERQQPVLLNV